MAAARNLVFAVVLPLIVYMACQPAISLTATLKKNVDPAPNPEEENIFPPKY